MTALCDIFVFEMVYSLIKIENLEFFSNLVE